MKSEADIWLEYADENLDSAILLHENGLYNSCLQNCQQAVEKYLKSVVLASGISFVRTHSIVQILQILQSSGIEIDLGVEEAELLDTIYLPSKYPVGNVLPDFNADSNICKITLQIGCKVKTSVNNFLKLG